MRHVAVAEAVEQLPQPLVRRARQARSLHAQLVCSEAGFNNARFKPPVHNYPRMPRLCRVHIPDIARQLVQADSCPPSHSWPTVALQATTPEQSRGLSGIVKAACVATIWRAASYPLYLTHGDVLLRTSAPLGADANKGLDYLNVTYPTHPGHTVAFVRWYYHFLTHAAQCLARPGARTLRCVRHNRKRLYILLAVPTNCFLLNIFSSLEVVKVGTAVGTILALQDVAPSIQTMGACQSKKNSHKEKCQGVARIIGLVCSMHI